MNRRSLYMAIIATFARGALIAGSQAPGAADHPSFDVASVKLSNPNPTGPFGLVPMMLPPMGGRVTATNMPLRVLIRAAYEVQDFQIVGGPSWQLSSKFDIAAKTEDGFKGGAKEVLPLMKTLLAERFKLKVHTEARDMPIYALVMARKDQKLGPDMKASTSDCANAQAEAQKRLEALAKGGPAAMASLLPKPGETRPCSITPVPVAGSVGMHGDGQAISVLTNLLTQTTGRIVQDRTGLMGLYDWTLKFDPEVLTRLISQLGVNLTLPANAPPSESPSLLTAIEEQLGMKLVSERGPVEMLVIDSAELPTPD